MNDGTVIYILRETVTMVILVAGPLLAVSLLLGLLISIFQATTQIQEQSLTFVPKLLGVLLTAVILGGWMLNTIITFTEAYLGNLGGFG